MPTLSPTASAIYAADQFGSISGNGLADDGAQIATVLAQISAAGGGTLRMSPGVTYGIATTINVPYGCFLDLPAATIFKALPGLVGPLVQNLTPSYQPPAFMGVMGEGTLDGNAIATYCVLITNAFGCQVRGLRVRGAARHGVLFANCTDCQVIGVDARNNSQSSAGTYYGIAFSGTSAHNVTAGCRGTDDQGTQTQQAGWGEVAGMTGNYNVYAGCDFSGNLSASPPPVVGANSGSTTTGTFSGATLAGPTITGNVAGGATYSEPTLAAPVLSGLPAGFGSTVATNFTAASSSGNATALASVAIPANTLSAGKALRIRAWGGYANNANTRQVALNWGGFQFASGTSGAYAGGSWAFEATVAYVSHLNQASIAYAIQPSGTAIIPITHQPNIDETASQTIVVVCQTQGANGDITFAGLTVEAVN